MSQPQAAHPEIKVKVEAGDFEEHIFETKGTVETHMRYADVKHIKDVREQNKERLVESCTSVISCLGEDLDRYENVFGVIAMPKATFTIKFEHKAMPAKYKNSPGSCYEERSGSVICSRNFRNT